MNNVALFSDVSSNPQLKCGVGACLLLSASNLESALQDIDRAGIAARIRFKRFTATSSTRLEIQTALWALEQYQRESCGATLGNLRIYTDSQCLTGLPARRADLESRQFLSRSSGKLLANASLYRAWYAASDLLAFELVKVAGHSRASSHDTVQRIFSLVDQAARKALRSWLAESGEWK
ncbi:MAG: ribonuclease H [Deltaproteobacteria bacterium]|nr:ribonuclease H [Deltaproteobacteria bacterium]TLN04410.1 MAG: ribonuclease H [bacterium]